MHVSYKQRSHTDEPPACYAGSRLLMSERTYCHGLHVVKSKLDDYCILGSSRFNLQVQATHEAASKRKEIEGALSKKLNINLNCSLFMRCNPCYYAIRGRQSERCQCLYLLWSAASSWILGFLLFRRRYFTYIVWDYVIIRYNNHTSLYIILSYFSLPCRLFFPFFFDAIYVVLYW